MLAFFPRAYSAELPRCSPLQHRRVRRVGKPARNFITGGPCPGRLLVQLEGFRFLQPARCFPVELWLLPSELALVGVVHN